MSEEIKRPKANIVRPKANTVEPSQVTNNANNTVDKNETLKKLQAEGLGTGGIMTSGITTGGSGRNASRSGSSAEQQNALLPVRKTLENAGLDSSKIGWANGQVTYGGRAFTPSENRNGTTYAGKDEIDSFIKGVQKDNGNLGVRDTFVGLGLNPDKIGWDNGYVTYNGARFKPAINANGTTYSPVKDVYSWANDALKTEGDGFVLVNEYMPANGLYDVGWNDAAKEVLIGGRSVPYAYIDENERAVAKKSDLEEAYNRLGKERGVLNQAELFNQYLQNSNRINTAIDDIRDREFTYSLENDPAYQSLKAMYQREGERAYEDMLAKASARTGGSMSSMARSQANQQYDYYMQKLNDAVPQLYQAAYERYIAEQNRDLDALSQEYGIYQNTYNSGMNASELAREAFYNQQVAQKQREYDDIELALALSERDDTLAQNAYNASMLYDTPIPAEVAIKYGIQPDAEGTYPTANEIVIRQQNALWEGYEKGMYNYQRAAEMQDYIDKMAIDLGAEKALAAYKQSIKPTAAKKTTETSDWSW